MRSANSIHIRVFSKEGEDEEKIAERIKLLAPFDFEKEKIKFRRETAISFNESKIKIFTLLLEKERHTTAFLKLLMSKLAQEQKELLLRQIETRLDTELNFFIRIDKEKLLNENRLWITDSGNCYHITISIAAFPRKREVALKVVDEILRL